VREQEQDSGDDGFNSMTSSPASSNGTGVSGYSSAGALALHRGVFCTPPRMFVEHQQVRHSEYQFGVTFNQEKLRIVSSMS
jgi:hypothetical protein